MKKIVWVTGVFLFYLLPNMGIGQENTASIFVNGLCDMCKERIEKTALNVKGVVDAEWNAESRLLSLRTQNEDFNIDKVHQAIAEVGHDTKKAKAKDDVYSQLQGCCQYRDPVLLAAHGIEGEMISLKVNGACGMCKSRIENAALQLDAVEGAYWDVKSHKLDVFVTDENFDENFDENSIHQAVAAVGHDTELAKASDEVYANLPACCKYRDAEVEASHGGGPSLFQPASVAGRILVEENGKTEPLPGVNIYWLNGKEVASTDEDGRFNLARPTDANQLIASYVGYYADTIALENETTIELVLTPGTTLDAIEVTYQRKSIEVSFIDPILTQKIDSRELLKAACCTLAESFETNPAVDVSFTDAVTGARQIEMLGLAGPYMQITRENLPDVRGLAAIYGLVYLPGPWVESIQLAKGPGSVINGYESITGQINVELKKPEEGEKFYLNLYGNEGGRLEANANTRIQLNDKWSTGFLVHGNNQSRQNDRNEDGFLEMPTGYEWTAINRWKYQGENGLSSQFGFKVTDFNKTSGQLAFDDDPSQANAWGAQVKTQRLEGWAKIGMVFLDRPAASIGLQLYGMTHNQDASFGNTRYDADQESFYANLIYRDELGSSMHKLNTGLSFQLDRYDELLGEGTFERNETVPGAFVEYTYQPSEKFTAVAGLRGDHHNNFGFFLTPRLHLRYALSDKSVLRMSAGQGRRTASIIAENLGMLASSRTIIIQNNNTDTPYGLNQEVAWNIGLNLRQTFVVQNRELIVTLDAYHTRFDQQIVVDYENPREVQFYNLDGRSFSNTFQGQIDYAIIKNLDLRLAYRFNDVQTDYNGGRLERPFVARHRAFANIGYTTDKGWAFDWTVNWQGSKRIPSTTANPAAFQLAGRSPDFIMVNAQISKTWWDKFDIYLGAENLFNFVQTNPILSSEEPFGPNFDSSLIWGPIFGRMVYAGIRFTIE